jgi:two-component system, response regulator
VNNRSTILIVDDSPSEQILVKRAILKSRPDCFIDTAADGPQALLWLQNNTPPTLILLDLKLPGMDGIDILRGIRGRRETRFAPVVILTSSKMDDDIMNAYNAGANGYLHKIHDLTQFAENIKTTLDYWIDINEIPGGFHP